MIAEFERQFDDYEPIDEALKEQREEEARRLLRQRTKDSLRRATEIRARQAQIAKAEADIDRILAQWGKVVRDRLNSLADRADSID